uniref:Putative pentatricopeptide repeat-containing protein At1g74400 n=1 Tax=Anthurium amnicola TaxID=1678845 RepID=A0A1D1XYS4_9ARAE
MLPTRQLLTGLTKLHPHLLPWNPRSSLHGNPRLPGTRLHGRRRPVTGTTPSRFRRLCRRGASSLDSFAVLGLLKVCSKGAPSAAKARQVHALAIRLGLEDLVFLRTAFMDAYSRAGCLTDAHQLFDDMPQRNAVCWTALVSAYVNNARPRRALELFRQMQVEGVDPDRVSATIALSACADLGALDMGEWIHAYIRRKKGFAEDLILQNALINMYAKCGDIDKARHLFDQVPVRDTTTWTSMIVGYALHGRSDEALGLFSELKEHSRKNIHGGAQGRAIPNQVTFIGVMMACSHAGLVEEGLLHLESMWVEYGLEPQMSHYGCMVDVFCRAGLLEEALAFMDSMPIAPNAVVWRTLLGACSLHPNLDVGARARQRLLKLEPHHTGDDIAIANVYAAAGLWDEKERMRRRVKPRRDPGCSAIEVESRVHEFVADDRKHPRMREILMVLKGMFKNLESPRDLNRLPSLVQEAS